MGAVVWQDGRDCWERVNVVVRNSAGGVKAGGGMVGWRWGRRWGRRLRRIRGGGGGDRDLYEVVGVVVHWWWMVMLVARLQQGESGLQSQGETFQMGAVFDGAWFCLRDSAGLCAAGCRR